jgi:cobalt-zinc-cadmium efflux system outer membrane protein
MAGGSNRQATRITDRPKGSCVMKLLQFLPLLVLVWASLAAAGNESQESRQAEVRREIEVILARPAIGLADLFRIGELVNPDLAVARIEIQARTGRMQQAGLYPNPELSFEVEEMSVDDPSFNKQKLEISQALLIGGRRGAAVNAARTEVDRAGEYALQARRQALGRIHEWWADQIHFREMEAAFDTLLGGAERTLAIAKTRFEAKAAPEAHVTRAMLEVYDLEVVRQDFERRRVRSAAEMKVLLGGIEVPVDRLRGSLDPDAQAFSLPPDTSAEIDDHPTLRAARLGVEVAEAMLETAKKERIPDLNLFAAYGRSRPDEGNFVEGGISLPLPIFHRNQGRVAETRSLVAMARHRERLAVHELEVALATARLNHRTAHEQLDQLAERIAPAAERALTQAQEAYRSGRLMFLELVDAQRTYNDVLLRTMELRRDLALAEADLMSLLGAGPYADIGEER